MGRLRGRHIRHRVRPILITQPHNPHRPVDRIPSLLRRWRRLHGRRRKFSQHPLAISLDHRLTNRYQAYIAVQNTVPAPQIPTAMSIVLFCQNLGGSVALPAANAIFSNFLRSELRDRIAIIRTEPDVIVDAGVRSIRRIVSGDALRATLTAYANAIDVVMYLGIGVAVAAFGFGWGLGFKDIRKVKKLREIRAEGNKEDDW